MFPKKSHDIYQYFIFVFFKFSFTLNFTTFGTNDNGKVLLVETERNLRRFIY